MFLPNLTKSFCNCNTSIATFLYDFIYINFKTEQNYFMVIKFQHEIVLWLGGVTEKWLLQCWLCFFPHLGGGHNGFQCVKIHL